MAATHAVVQGEHLTKIAAKYGFRDSGAIWDHPQNSQLKKKRENPNVLEPGDQIYIPDKQQKTETLKTGKAHRFKLRGGMLKLRFVLRGYNEKPLANLPVVLKVEDKVYKLTTNSDGIIEQSIPESAENGTLTYQNMEVPIKIGHLDPVDRVAGWQARLNNLGYDAGTSGDPDDPRLRSAIQEFQCDRGLTVDGICGPATQAKLKQAHGS